MGQGGLPLVSIGERLDSWSRSPLHPTLLPVGALALVHAVRVSHATRQVAGSKKCRLGLWQGFLLNQILMFGGVVVSGMLLAVPSLLLTGWPIVVLYGGVHVLLDITPGGMLLLSAQEVEFMGILMDLSFALLDGVFRAEGIIDLGIEAVRTHRSAEVSSSYFAALLNAAIIGGGVPLLIDLFKLDSPTGEWGFRSPAWAKSPWQGTNDLASSTFLGAVYVALTSPPPARNPIIGAMVKSIDMDKSSSQDVRTFCSLLLGAVLLAEKATVLAKRAHLPTKPLKAIPAAPREKPVKNGSTISRKQAGRKLR